MHTNPGTAAVRRPLLVTAVGVIGIVAGIFPLAEIVAILLSARFAAWFLPLMRSILPVSDLFAFTLLFGIAVADIGFGIGVLARKRFARFGMIARSLIATRLVDKTHQRPAFYLCGGPANRVRPNENFR